MVSYDTGTPACKMFKVERLYRNLFDGRVLKPVNFSGAFKRSENLIIKKLPRENLPAGV